MVQTLIFPSTITQISQSTVPSSHTVLTFTALKGKSCTHINISELHVNKQPHNGSVKITEPCSKTFHIAGEVQRVCSVNKNQVGNFYVCSYFQLHSELFQLKMKLELIPEFFFFIPTHSRLAVNNSYFFYSQPPTFKRTQKSSSDLGSAPVEKSWSLAMSTGASVLEHSSTQVPSDHFILSVWQALSCGLSSEAHEEVTPSL